MGIIAGRTRLCCYFGLVIVSLFTLCGCGPSGPQCVPVSGKVTFNGGKVPGPGFIYFNIDISSGAASSRPGTAEFDADGNYTTKSFVPGDGLLPGKYVLRVDCWKTPPNMDGKPIVSYIPDKYQNAAQSGLTLTVEPDLKPVTFNIDLTSR